MAIRTFLDLPRNEAGLVDRFLGTAYDNVKLVAQNIDAIKAVPSELSQIQGLESNISNSFTDAQNFITDQLTQSQSNLDTMTDLDNSGRLNASIAIERASAASTSANSAQNAASVATSKLQEVNQTADTVALNANNAKGYATTAEGYRDQLAADVLDIQNRYQAIINANNSSATSASAAQTSENNAATSAAAAKSSEQIAEQLTKSALEAAKTFPDTATGIANTTDGEFFNIIGSGDVAVESYINKNGSAVFQTSTPSYTYAKRLDDEKVNRSGDTVTGDLAIEGVLTSTKYTECYDHVTINSNNKVYGLITSQYDSGATALGLHKNDGTYSAFIINNPDSSIDFLSHNGTATINGARLLTVNDTGTGNGLDAGLLNGHDASYFAKASDAVSASLGAVYSLGDVNAAGLHLTSDRTPIIGWYEGSTFTTTGLARQDALNSTNQSVSSINSAKVDRSGDTMDWLRVNNAISVKSLQSLDKDQYSLQAYYGNNKSIAFQADGNCVYYDGSTTYASISPTLANFPSNTVIAGNTVWHRGNDGAGSGLNADLLDGIEGSAYLRTGGSTFTGDSYVNGWALYCSNNGSKARMNFEIIDHISYWNNAGNLAAHFDLSGDSKNLYVQGHIGANGINTSAFAAYDNHVDVVYANRRFSFQTDGNAVNYGTDGAVLTSMMDGNIWTRGVFSSANNVNATGMLHIQSFNGLNGLDMHSDDDGVVRMYAKNGNVDWQQFLTFNPQGDLNFSDPTGAVYINGQRIFARNYMGAGSGLDADTFRSYTPDSFVFASTFNALQDTVANDCLKTSAAMGSTDLPVLGLHMTSDNKLIVVYKDKNGNVQTFTK